MRPFPLAAFDRRGGFIVDHVTGFERSRRDGKMEADSLG